MNRTLYFVAVLGLVTLFAAPLSSEVIIIEIEPDKNANLQDVHDDKAMTGTKRETQDDGFDGPMNKYRKLKQRLAEEEMKKKKVDGGLKLLKRRPVEIVLSEVKKSISPRAEALVSHIRADANAEDEDACIDEEEPTDSINSNNKPNAPPKGKPVKRENKWSIRDLKSGSRKRNVEKVEQNKAVEEDNEEEPKEKKPADKKTETKNKKPLKRDIFPRGAPNSKPIQAKPVAEQKAPENTDKMSTSEENVDYSEEEYVDEEPVKRENQWSIRDMKSGSRKRNVDKVEQNKAVEEDNGEAPKENKTADKKTETKNKKPRKLEIFPRGALNSKPIQAKPVAEQKAAENTDKMSTSEENVDSSEEEYVDEERVDEVVDNELEDSSQQNTPAKEDKSKDKIGVVLNENAHHETMNKIKKRC